ncbi:PAS domain-containing protein [Streptomyces sp. NPDC006365]|uniref:PAS domain-containing protein n=1 Tax=Streptomyces sp. NPDC006365 TaxID=3364744 RepID=UPI00368CE96E
MRTSDTTPDKDAGASQPSRHHLSTAEDDGMSSALAGTPGERTSPQCDDVVLGLVRATGEAVFTVDAAWRITFANDSAERLLGPGRLFGDDLWEMPAARVPGLEVQCRRASVGGKTVEFDLRWPGDRGLRRVRVIPVRDRGQIISLSEATEPRQTEVGQNARTQSPDRLASRMSE